MVEQIVIVAFGPSGVTRAALRRARQLVGVRGRIVVVAPLPTGRPALDAAEAERGVVVVRTHGPEGIVAALVECRPGPVLMLHDDLLVTADSARRLLETWRRHGGYVVPWTNDMDIDHCVGALPPVAQAARALGPAVQSVRRREGHVYRVRPVCILGEREALAELSLNQLHNPLTVLNDVDSVYRVAAGAVAVHDAECRAGLAAPEGPDGRPLLVAHLIVKDEEAMLGDCLASLDGVVDRIVVCDTGSRDRTVEIARSFGAQVIEREWRDDFGWARNEALDQCRDAWYVLTVDADERVVCPDPVLMRRLLATFAGEVLGYELRIRNLGVDADREAVDFWDTRLFQTEGIRWFGALHEKPRLVEHPEVRLKGNRLSTLELDHLGYAPEIVAGRDKQARNLEIAEATYLRERTGHAAFELGRALVYAHREPERARELFEEALTYHDLGHDLQSFALGFVARLLGSAGRVEEGYDRAVEALAVWPTLDQPAEAFAVLAEALGRHEELVATIRRIRAAAPLQPVFADEDGIADVTSRFIGSLAVLGEVAEAGAEALALLDHKPKRFQHWEQLVQAAAAVHQGDELAAWLAPLVRRAVGDAFVAPLAAVMDPAELTAFLLRYLDTGGDEPAAVAAALTAAMVGRDWTAFRTLLAHVHRLDARIVENLADRLTAQGFGGISAELHAAVARPSVAAAPGRPGPAAVAVGAPVVARGMTVADLGPVARVFDGVPTTADLVDLDPADAVVVRIPGGDPTSALTRLAALGLVVERQVREHQAAGTTDDHGFAWLLVARPAWTEATVTRAVELLESPPPAGATGRLAVLVTGLDGDVVGAELAVGLRASLPASVGLTFVADVDGLPADQAVLVVDADVVPEPRWVQALWTTHLATGAAAGVRLVDPEGRLVHAGAGPDGTPFGGGSEWGHAPLFTAARAGATLLAPFVAPASALRTGDPVGGAYLGYVAAVTHRPAIDATPGAPSVRDIFGPSVLVLGDRSPVDLDDAGRAGLREALDAIRAAGLQPVYRWEAVGTPDGRPDLAAWEARGDVLFGGDPHTDAPGRGAWELLAPTPGALVGAWSPVAVVHAGLRSLERDFADVSVVDLEPISAYAGPAPALAERALLERVEVVAEELGADLVAEIVARHGGGRSSRPPAVARFSPPATPRPGVVSVVIPVWNQWRLTQRCLDSLARHAEVPLDIVVVDNGSTDDTPKGLAARPDVVVITNDRNLGFPKAVNQGIAAASGEWICVLNNDTEVTPGWLTEQLAALAVPGTGMVGPRSNAISGLQVVPDVPALTEGAVAHAWAEDWSRAHRGVWWPTARLVGFCLLVRRDVLETVGGFDEGFGIGNYEDDELGQRIIAAGLSLRVADGSVVLHHGGATFRQLGLDYATLMAQAGRRFLDGRTRTAGLLHGFVLGDGDAAAAAVSARSLLAVVDAVTVLERRGQPATELLVSGATAGRARVRAVDWTDPSAAAAAVTAVPEQIVVVLGAGEHLGTREWGRTRAEVEVIAGDATVDAVEVRLGERREVRLHRRSIDAVAAIGGTADRFLDHAWIQEPLPSGEAAATAAPAGAAAVALADLPLRPTSVVVVTYNSMATIADCLDSVLAADPCEVVVVDNASADGTAAWLEAYAAEHPEVRVVASDVNLGFSAGCNRGVDKSYGEYVVLLNPDTVVTTGWLRRMQAHFVVGDHDAPVGAVGPLSDYVAGLQQWGWYVPEPLAQVDDPEAVAEQLGRQRAGLSLPTRLLIGFCLMVPRAIWDDLGGLDEELFLGNDDLDLSWRLRQQGFQLKVATDAFVQHEGQVSFRSEPSARVQQLVRESSDALARKLLAHYGPGRVPTSEELWGMNWFQPTFDLWAPAPSVPGRSSAHAEG